MRFIDTFAKWVFMLCLPVLLLTASIALAVNSPQVYEHGFEKYNISRATGLSRPELSKAAAGLIRYFNSDKEYISLIVVKDGAPFRLFNEREVAHLKDVKALFWRDYRALLVTLIYTLSYAGACLFLWKDRRKLGWGLIGGSGITLAMILALGLGTLLDFNQLFWQFHLISFTNKFWQLDPTKDYLIMLFPQGFWYDMTMLIALMAAAGAVILGGAGVFLRLAGRKAPAKAVIRSR